MKIIFLDIDGVLNVHYPKHDKYGSIFHPNFVENLRTVVKETGANIVITSTWRMSGFDVMRDMWRDRKLPGKVIGITPINVNRDGTERIFGFESLNRGNEIKWWINNCDIKIDNYVIIDDDTDMLDEQMDNFVITSENTDHTDYVDIGYGLTIECAQQAINILNK